MQSSMKAKIQSAKRGVRRAHKFVKADVWDIEIGSLPAMRAFGVRFLRVVLLVFKGFREDECSMHASALTFSTLMAIVPVLALTLSMARGLGDADTAKRWIQTRVQDWTETFKVDAVARNGEAPREEEAEPEAVSAAQDEAEVPEATSEAVVRSELAERINLLVERGFEKVEDINFTRLGTLGLVLLIWMVIEMLGRIERSFNRVWGIRAGRSVWRRFTDYISVLLILPVLIAAAASLPAIEAVTRFMPEDTAAFVQRLVDTGFYKNMVVVTMTTLTFCFVIMFMPNTSMGLGAGLAGGFVAGVLFLAWLAICAMLQVGAARYGRIYGSFAVVPILLAWVHVSWQIVLLGAEVAFAVENYATYKMEQVSEDANVHARLTLALLIVTEAGRRMLQHAPPFDVAAFGRQQTVPVRFLNAVTADLVRAGYMAELAGPQGGYALLRSPESLSACEIMDVVMRTGTEAGALGLTQVNPKISEAVEQALNGMDQQLKEVTIGKLLTA